MLDLAISSPHAQESYAIRTLNPTHTFLVKSERRVILHCEKMLAANDVPDDQRRRLTRIRNEAIDQLQRLER